MVHGNIKPMMPSLVTSLPERGDWVYEIKYDGYRCLIYCSIDEIRMTSRNGIELGASFPEVKRHMNQLKEKWASHLPFILDGELCILLNDKKADFEAIQLRGRLKNNEQIEKKSLQYPASFLVFDCLMKNGQWLTALPLKARKDSLSSLLSLEEGMDKILAGRHLNNVDSYDNVNQIQADVLMFDGEGIVAKHLKSSYDAGTRTRQWLKWKNMKKASFVLTAYDDSNGYFHVSAVEDNTLRPAGLFSHGLSPEERDALIQTIKNNASHKEGSLIYMKPFLCVELEYLEVYKQQLRQPRFSRFMLNTHWEDCTWENVIKNSTASP